LRTKLPVVVTISSRVDESQAVSALEELAAIVGFEKGAINGTDSLFFKRTELPLGDWSLEIDEVAEFLMPKLEKKEVHLALNVPTAFALALGIRISSSQIPPMCIYHFQTGTYYKVIDLTDNSRKIKAIRNEAKRTEAKFLKTGEDEVAIVCQFASHTLEGSVRKFLESRNITTDLLEIRHASSGNIALGDWSVEVSEVYSAIQKLREEGYYKRLHLFLAVPVSFAFALGLALGRYVPLTVYQYNPLASDTNELYIPIFKL